VPIHARGDPIPNPYLIQLPNGYGHNEITNGILMGVRMGKANER
jgi:hypothetical protein